MMDIHAYIRYLLNEEGRIVLPGMGVLTAHYDPAGVNIGEGSFHPPSQRLRFSASEEPADSLVRQISQLSGRNEMHIRKEIEEYFQKLDRQLQQDGHCHLMAIGTIKKGKGGKLSFEADPRFNEKGNAFGLESFQFPRKKGKSEVAKANPAIAADVRRADLSWLLALAIAILIAAGGFFWAMRYFDPSQVVRMYFVPIAGEQLIENPSPKVSRPADTTSVMEVRETRADTMPAEDSLGEKDSITSPVDSMETAVEPGEENFFIVAGVFRTDKGVNRTIERLKSWGYPAKVFKTTSRGIRYVCYQGFESREEAEKALDKVRQQGDSEAWIWPQE